MEDGNFKIGFIGLGLIGGSIAKAIKRVKNNYIISAFDTDHDCLTFAQRDKIIDHIYNDVDMNFSELDLIFLCSPVINNIEYLRRLKNIIKPSCIITDVGSVKTQIHEAVINLGLTKNFIGGHPMAGSEKTGYSSSNNRLLENAYYMITPFKDSNDTNIKILADLVKEIGSIPFIVDYEEHDFITAGISHLPHIIASCLVNLVKELDNLKGDMKKLSAGGFKDITRIASSSPIMWQQICLSNSLQINSVLNAYINSLTEISNSINNKDYDFLLNLFEDAKEYREQIPNSSIGAIEKVFEIYVDVLDESGVIAKIATILANNHINIKNIGIVHNREFQDGALRIEFYDEDSVKTTDLLLTNYNYTIHKRG